MAHGDTAKQAPELEPWQFYNMAMLIPKCTGTLSVMASAVLSVTMGCIRFEHIQRSQYVSSNANYHIFNCAMGKRRVQGARPPFEWTAPVLLAGPGHEDISAEFLLLQAEEAHWMRDKQILLPGLAKHDLLESHTQMTQTTMTRVRLVEILRALL